MSNIFNPNEILLTDEMMKVWGLLQTPGAGHVLVTGKAGSGKTTFLKYIKDMTTRNLVVAAPTGVAAVNAGGVTLHSLFMLPLGSIPPESPLENNLNRGKIQILRKMEILVIDEVSMVRPDTLDAVDHRLRLVRKSDRPFGGVQVVMFGDPFQLPPVISDADSDIFGTYYDCPYFYGAKVWDRSGFEVVELKKIFRQENQEFIDILNHMREYKMTTEDYQKLIGVSAAVKGVPPLEVAEKMIHLCTHKSNAAEINDMYLQSMLKSSNGTSRTYRGKSEDNFKASSYPSPDRIELCPGARVMSLVNNFDEGYFNGSLGTVTKCDQFGVYVELDDTGLEVLFGPYTWNNTEYTIDKETKKVSQKVIGKYTQIPLIPAWAITIHKSQGLTFDYVFLHIKNVFSPGQLYVALSRCRSLEGVETDVPIGPGMVKANQELIDFYEYIQEHNSYYTRVNG